MDTANDPSLPTKRRPGRPKGLGRVPGSGRKPGTANRLTVDLKELILKRGKPVELLADVARGIGIRIGPQAGPGEPTFVYPTLEQRVDAAKTLLAKIMPAPSSVELTGADGGPIQTADVGDFEVARRLAFVLASAVHIEDEAALPPRSAEPALFVPRSEPETPATAPEPIQDAPEPVPEPVPEPWVPPRLPEPLLPRLESPYAPLRFNDDD